MSIQNISALAILTCFIGACEKSEIQTSDSNVAVVESFLSPGSNVLVNIKRELIYGNDTAQLALSDLSVIFSDSITSEVLTPTDTGSYVSSNMIVEAGKSYSISFQYNNKTISSSTSIPSKPTNFAISVDSIGVSPHKKGNFGEGTMPNFTKIDITWDNADNSYYMVVVKNIETNPVLIDTSSNDSPERFAMFRNQPQQVSSDEIMPQSFTYYGWHQVILFHLFPDYASLYLSNGSTSLNLTPPPSNISNGLGIFTGINADTLLLKVYEP
jgi:hypothetical protein